MSEVPIGVVTISDRASAGLYEDKGGPGIEAALEAILATPWRSVRRLVPDEREAIEAALRELADVERCALILTTGGTGPSPRDVTPEATEAVCDRVMPGFGELMRARSLMEVPTAILSRQIAGLRGRSLIVNLPGKPSAIRTCLDAVFAAVPYCLDLIGGDRLETNPEVCVAFRPKKVTGASGRPCVSPAIDDRANARPSRCGIVLNRFERSRARIFRRATGRRRSDRLTPAKLAISRADNCS